MFTGMHRTKRPEVIQYIVWSNCCRMSKVKRVHMAWQKCKNVMLRICVGILNAAIYLFVSLF